MRCAAVALRCVPADGAGRSAACRSHRDHQRQVFERIDIGISTNEIAIASDFSGADITVFGAIDGADELLLSTFAYDVVVALEGPRKPTTVAARSASPGSGSTVIRSGLNRSRPPTRCRAPGRWPTSPI
jgi:uncharacterized protein (TIGR02186 family)